jgi:hypothetical protein
MHKTDKFDHLVLLIGTNPLPNFIAADFFLKQNQNIKKICLIHSEKKKFQSGTNKEADNLEKLLKEKHQDYDSLEFPLEKIAISDVSNAKIIRSDIEQKMLPKLKGAKGIHLNYTGGTKSMSTHVYWILRETEKAKTDFSYLDARSFRLISDEKGVIESDLRKKITLSFDEMIRLHGFKRKNKANDFLFPEALKVFQRLIESDQLHKYFGENGYNREYFLDDKGNLAETIKKLSGSNKDRLKGHKPKQELSAIISAMPEEYRLFDREGNFNDQVSNKNFERSVKFLDGNWLENHVTDSLKAAIMECPISIEQNWVIKKPDPDWDNLDFELDVVLINGYQLTAISCTTDKEKYSKNKGFEIIHRTRQIGGDEAKAVLITLMNDSNRYKVQQELKVHTGGNQSNILVLGENDLKKETLAKKISNFILTDE